MDAVFEALAQRSQQVLFSGLKRITQTKQVSALFDVPYGQEPRHTLDIFQPVGVETQYTLLFIHGGSWQYGSKDYYAYLGQALAKQGIASVVINYRLFPQARYPEFVDDAAMALAWMRTSGDYYGLNEAPLFLMGHSAGAHIALLATLDEGFAQRFGYDVQPIKGVICLAGVYSFRPENSPTFQKIFPSTASGSDYGQVKPVNFVKSNGVPLYLLHGRKDKTVACRSAERMYKNALLAGHPVFLDIRENYGHSDMLFDFLEFRSGHKDFMASLRAFMQDNAL